VIYLHAIEHAVPPGAFSQADFAAVQLALLKDDAARRYAKGIYKDSGIEMRHSVVVEPGGKLACSFYGIGEGQAARHPGTR
jgi:hypothetical protein